MPGWDVYCGMGAPGERIGYRIPAACSKLAATGITDPVWSTRMDWLDPRWPYYTHPRHSTTGETHAGRAELLQPYAA